MREYVSHRHRRQRFLQKQNVDFSAEAISFKSGVIGLKNTRHIS